MSKEIEELLAVSKSYLDKKDAEGLKFATRAYHDALEVKNIPLVIAALKTRVNYALKIQLDYAEIERLTLEMQSYLDIRRQPVEASQTYNTLGICNDVKGNYIEARNNYLKTVELLEGHTLPDNEGVSVLGNAYYNLAKLYMQIESAEERTIYVDKALKTFDSIDDVTGLARVWNLKAAMLSENDPIEQRLGLFEKAFGYFERGTDAGGYSTCLANIGLCYCRLKQFDKGIEILLKALTRVTITSNQPLLGFTLFQLGEAYRLKGSHELAIEYLKQAEEVMLKAKAKVYLNVVYREWATNLAAIGNYTEAYEKMQKFVGQVEDRLEFGRQSAVAEARMKFELEKKEKESELLKRKNEEIAIYNEKLQHSNAELNQFAYVASHDLKEPLRMVSNYMQLLEKSFDKELTEDQSTYINYAADGAKRMYTLIDSLLVFSRATMDSEVKMVDLNDVLDEVLRVVRSTVKSKVMVDADALPVIKVDHDQMVQLFQNLISNSIKYNNSKEIIIRISYTSDPRSHRIAFEDNGIGIESQHREKVFEIFKRLHPREVYSGTGIGLSICKKIIHRLNGRVWIEDSELGGTAFVFTIPK